MTDHDLDTPLKALLAAIGEFGKHFDHRREQEAIRALSARIPPEPAPAHAELVERIEEHLRYDDGTLSVETPADRLLADCLAALRAGSGAQHELVERIEAAVDRVAPQMNCAIGHEAYVRAVLRAELRAAEQRGAAAAAAPAAPAHADLVERIEAYKREHVCLRAEAQTPSERVLLNIFGDCLTALCAGSGAQEPATPLDRMKAAHKRMLASADEIIATYGAAAAPAAPAHADLVERIEEHLRYDDGTLSVETPADRLLADCLAALRAGSGAQEPMPIGWVAPGVFVHPPEYKSRFEVPPLDDDEPAAPVAVGEAAEPTWGPNFAGLCSCGSASWNTRTNECIRCGSRERCDPAAAPAAPAATPSAVDVEALLGWTLVSLPARITGAPKHDVELIHCLRAAFTTYFARIAVSAAK